MKSEYEIELAIDTLKGEYDLGILAPELEGYLRALCWVLDTTLEDHESIF
jgi:hypothetical protein